METTFQSTPPRTGGDNMKYAIDYGFGISIHAPRAGGDDLYHDIAARVSLISIHAPRAGGDRTAAKSFPPLLEFQSTPPVRGATAQSEEYCEESHQFQSTPPVRGATAQSEEYCEESHQFQSTPPVRGATDVTVGLVKPSKEFQSTPPVRGATLGEYSGRHDPCISIHAPRAGGDAPTRSWAISAQWISIHAPRAGGDFGHEGLDVDGIVFQSTPPVRGATLTTIRMPPCPAYFNPRPPCGGRQRASTEASAQYDISIHAPRAGGDLANDGGHRLISRISIHAPRAGGDPTRMVSVLRSMNFNPRPPCGGRPVCSLPRRLRQPFQSTPPVRGATGVQHTADSKRAISIHAPRAGGDGLRRTMQTPGKRFQSTPPVRGATFRYPGLLPPLGISIHAPRAGGDFPSLTMLTMSRKFQSTPPVRGATVMLVIGFILLYPISIHAPRAGGD